MVGCLPYLQYYLNEPQRREGHEERVLVVDASLPKDFDLVAFSDEIREERIQETLRC